MPDGQVILPADPGTPGRRLATRTWDDGGQTVHAHKQVIYGPDGEVLSGPSGVQVDPVRPPPALEVSGSGLALNATPIASTDVGRYRWVSVQLSGPFTATVAFEVSDDGATWATAPLAGTTWAGTAPNGFSSGIGVFHGPVYGRYFRVRISGYTSGTVTATAPCTIALWTWSWPASAKNCAVAAGAADSGSPVKVGGRYNATSPTLGDGQRGDLELDSRGSLNVNLRSPNSDFGPSAAAPTDGLGNQAGLTTRNQALVFNGTTWDRWRGDTNGAHVQGNVAHGAADAGRPAKVGGVYNATDPTLSSGQRGDLQLDRAGALTVRQRTIDSFKVVGRVAAVNVRGSLSFAQAANTDKQWLTLHHPSTATKVVKIRYIALILVDVSAATILNFDLRKITTAPATGNPAITPAPMNGANAGTECTALALPGTAGTAAATPSYGLAEFDSGILAPPTAPPGYQMGLFELYNAAEGDENEQSIELRAGVLEGVAIIVRATVAATVNAIPIIRYTEELA